MGSRDQSVGASGSEAFKAQVGMAKRLISKRFRGPSASGSQRAPVKRLKAAIMAGGEGSGLPRAPSSSGGGTSNPLRSSDLFPPDAASRSLHVSELMGLGLGDGAGFAEDLDTGAVHSAREVPPSVGGLPVCALVTEDRLQLVLGVGVGSSPDWGPLGSAVRVSGDFRGGEVRESVGHVALPGPSHPPPSALPAVETGEDPINVASPARNGSAASPEAATRIWGVPVVPGREERETEVGRESPGAAGWRLPATVLGEGESRIPPVVEIILARLTQPGPGTSPSLVSQFETATPGELVSFRAGVRFSLESLIRGSSLTPDFFLSDSMVLALSKLAYL